MTRNRATIAHIARIEASRDIVSQAGLEGAARRSEIGREPADRLARLLIRALTHRKAGRMQAAAAALRMAKKLIALIPE